MQWMRSVIWLMSERNMKCNENLESPPMPGNLTNHRSLESFLAHHSAGAGRVTQIEHGGGKVASKGNKQGWESLRISLDITV